MYAYFPRSGDTEDCPAAIEYWKGGFASFGTKVPPKFGYQEGTKRGKEPYDTYRATSFVALYNPKDTPKMDCGFVRCPARTETVVVDGVPTTKVLAEAANALVCLSNPTALEENKSPYT